LPPAGACADGATTFEAGRGKAPLLTMFGGDITTARLRAEQAVSRLRRFIRCRRAGPRRRRCRAAIFAWARFDRQVELARARWRFLDDGQAQRLVAAYGTRLAMVARRRRSRAELGPAFGPELTRGRGALSDGKGVGALSGRHSVAALETRPHPAAGRSRGAGRVHGDGTLRRRDRRGGSLVGDLLAGKRRDRRGHYYGDPRRGG